MLYTNTLLAVVATTISLGQAVAVAASNSSYFKPPTLRPFIHINLLLDRPTNATTPDGFILHVPNRGGKITGNITGDLVSVGAANEFFPSSAKGSTSFYSNAWALSTNQGATINMNVEITVHYGGSSGTDLHGFGPISFVTGDPRYRDLNYASFYAEIDGVVTTGVVNVDVFQLVSNGRVDGTLSPALAFSPPSA